jgi:hypothetical protein
VLCVSYRISFAEEALPDGLERCVVKAKGFPPQLSKADVRAAAAAYQLAPVASSEQVHASGCAHAAIVRAGTGAFLADNVYWGVKGDGAPSGTSVMGLCDASVGFLLRCTNIYMDCPLLS